MNKYEQQFNDIDENILREFEQIHDIKARDLTLKVRLTDTQLEAFIFSLKAKYGALIDEIIE